MSVVGLHPEQLIDKLEAGTLSGAERAQLDLHLEACETCRLELAMRSDFAADAPLAFPEHPELMLTLPELAAPPVRRVSTAVARRGRRRRLLLLAVAATLCASGAVAALSNGVLPWRAWFHEPAPTAPPAASAAKAASNKGAGRKPALAAAANAVTDPTADMPTDPQNSEVVEAAPSAAAPVESRPLAVHSLERAATSAPVLVAPLGSARALPSGQAAFPSVVSGTPEAAVISQSDAAGLFAEASRARRDGNTGHAIALYRQLQRDYPSSPESQLSVALIAKIMLDRGDPAAAAADYDRYLRDGAPVLNAEALVGRARALEQLGHVDAAVAAWREVAQRFPGSVHARLAATRLAALGAP